jgi:hypothetical protein
VFKIHHLVLPSVGRVLLSVRPVAKRFHRAMTQATVNFLEDKDLFKACSVFIVKKIVASSSKVCRILRPDRKHTQYLILCVDKAEEQRIHTICRATECPTNR